MGSKINEQSEVQTDHQSSRLNQEWPHLLIVTLEKKTIYYTKLVLTPQTLLFGVSVIFFVLNENFYSERVHLKFLIN